MTAVGHTYNTKDILHRKCRRFNQMLRFAKHEVVQIFSGTNSNFTPEQMMEMRARQPHLACQLRYRKLSMEPVMDHVQGALYPYIQRFVDLGFQRGPYP